MGGPKKEMVMVTKVDTPQSARATNENAEQSYCTRVREAAKDPNVRKIAASTVGGAAVVGSAGGVGLGAGTVVGAAVGVVPALFTFGLSIPVGAAIGGGIGLVTGGSVGAVGGGALGFAGYTYKNEIGESKDKVCGYLNTKAKELGESKEKARGFLNTKVKDLKDRMSSTSGTA